MAGFSHLTKLKALDLSLNKFSGSMELQGKLAFFSLKKTVYDDNIVMFNLLAFTLSQN